ncbi:hypothetical protein BJ170DRAFT_632714 [Xylariales sp. AK1849]|nr:hypothetical protein BJ170DRAFT_632714 [Xylariales sp. AK1849]
MAMRSNGASVVELISNAAACARMMQSGRGSSAELRPSHSDTNACDLNLALGAAYCIGSHLDTNIFDDIQPLIFTSIYKYNPIPFEAINGEDYRVRWMKSQVEFSRLCAMIAAARQDENRKQKLVDDLGVWRASLPSLYDDIDQPHVRNIASDSKKLWLFCRYHQANLSIQMGPWGQAFDSQVFASARIVLEATGALPTPVILSDQ